MWGAFDGEGRCYAISQPLQSTAPDDSRPFAAVGHWPARGIWGQLHIRLGKEKRPGSAVLLKVDGRVFQLTGNGRNAWAPSPEADAEILKSMRTGIDMVVETRAADGRRLRDHYQLRGAATAMDAAAVACARRN